MTFQGSCPDMCPEAERQFRFGLSLPIFEKDRDNQPDEYAMVKEYRRSSADQKDPEPADLRTPQALSETMDYLVCNIMDDPRSNTKETALDWYDFLWDRLRAIRKDITQQNICDEASVILVERCARFHVHACYAMNHVKNFDVDMNKRNLNDCLQMLRQMYSDLRITQGVVCEGELEFQLYDVLLHLNDDHLASTILMKTSDYRETSKMRSITKIVIAYSNNDYYNFFRRIRSANYMTSCILSLYVPRMRILGLKSIINACPPRQFTLYPYSLAIESLGFDDEHDLKSFADYYGIEVIEKNGDNFLSLNRDLIQSLRSKESQLQYQFKSRHLVESKRNGQPIGLLIDGRDHLPQNPYRVRPLAIRESIPEDQEYEIDQIQDQAQEHHQDYDLEDEKSQSMDFQDEPLVSHEPEPKLSFTFNRPPPPIFRPSPPRTMPKVAQNSGGSPKRLSASFLSKSPDSLSSGLPSPFALRSPKTVVEQQLPKIFLPSPPISNSSSSPIPSLANSSSNDKTEPEESPMTETHPMCDNQEQPERSPSPASSEEEVDLTERRQEIADIMPAGRYKVVSMNAKIPKLRPPSKSNGLATPAKQLRSRSKLQAHCDTIALEVRDEAQENGVYKQYLASLDTNKVLGL